MAQKTCLITGATTGLGLRVATFLVQNHGYHVLMACRDLEKAKAIAESLNESTLESTTTAKETTYSPGKATAVKLDLGVLDSVRECANEVLSILNGSGLQLLICNAAVIPVAYGKTVDGIEETLAVNHYGHHLLISLLLKNALSLTESRITMVSSALHLKTPTEDISRHLDNPKSDPVNFKAFPDQYRLSKRFNSLLAHHLAVRVIPDLEKSSSLQRITASSVSPGFVPSTSLNRHSGRLVKILMKWILPIFLSVVKTEDEGAQAIIDVSLVQGEAFVNGGYHQDGKWLEEWGSDPETEQRLWDVSCDVVGIARNGDVNGGDG